MNKKDFWQIFIRTGKVSDYLNYKNARDTEYFESDDEEFSDEFAQDMTEYDCDYPSSIEEYEDVDQNGRYSDT